MVDVFYPSGTFEIVWKVDDLVDSVGPKCLPFGKFDASYADSSVVVAAACDATARDEAW